MSQIECISPVDGSVYVTRPTATPGAARDLLALARRAQRDWARRPLEERIALVEVGIARLDRADVAAPAQASAADRRDRRLHDRGAAAGGERPATLTTAFPSHSARIMP
jgi:acyl-CoA reductase-like NAD-dependent aldehyde dehydrogenase